MFLPVTGRLALLLLSILLLLLSFQRGLSFTGSRPVPPPPSITSVFPPGAFSCSWSWAFLLPGPPFALPASTDHPIALPVMPVGVMVTVFSLPTSHSLVHRALVVMSAAPLALPLLTPCPIMLLTAAVMDVMPAFFPMPGVTVFIGLIGGTLPVTVVLARCMRLRGLHPRGDSFLCRATLPLQILGFVPASVRANAAVTVRFHHQRPVQVGFDVRAELEVGSQPGVELLLVQCLAAGQHVLPNLGGALLPHGHHL